MDVTKAIEARSDQVNADDLIGGPMTIRITSVSVKSGADQPIEISFDGSKKVWRPCKTASRCLAAIWGSNAANWSGMHCTIYNDPTVQWAGIAVGGVRISHMEGLDKPRTLQLTKTRGKKGAVTIQPLVTESAPVVKPEAAQTEAREAAKQGRNVFNQWWKDNSDKRDAVKPIMDELKTSVEEYESRQTVDDDETPL